MLDTWAKSIGSRGGGRGGDVFGENGSVGQGFDLDRSQVLVAAGGARAATTRLENDVLEPLHLCTRRLLFYFYFYRDFALDV